MDSELTEYKNKLQEAFDRRDIQTAINLIKELKALNVEIPFSVEVQEKQQIN